MVNEQLIRTPTIGGKQQVPVTFRQECALRVDCRKAIVLYFSIFNAYPEVLWRP